MSEDYCISQTWLRLPKWKLSFTCKQVVPKSDVGENIHKVHTFSGVNEPVPSARILSHEARGVNSRGPPCGCRGPWEFTPLAGQELSHLCTFLVSVYCPRCEGVLSMSFDLTGLRNKLLFSPSRKWSQIMRQVFRVSQCTAAYGEDLFCPQRCHGCKKCCGDRGEVNAK